MTLEKAIEHAEQVANDYEDMTDDYALDSEKLHKCANEHRQLAAWLRELQEKRKEDSCEGCVNESGKANSLVCYTCRRHWHYVDLYEERRTNDQTDKGPSR